MQRNLEMAPVSASPLQSNAGIEQLSAQNFSRLAELIQSYSGIKMPPSKRTMLEGRLRRRMRVTHHDSINAYCQHLFEADGLAAELIDLIDAVTTNKTEFFREPAHFDFLVRIGLPALIESGRYRLKAWSAACSTGAEPYTLAMVLNEALEGAGVDYEIVATDLSTAVLREALAGRYSAAMIEPVPYDLRRRYLMRARDAGSTEVRIAPRLRAKIAFARLNLMDERYPLESDFDVIFCRNVLIYFDKPTQAQVLARLCDHLRPGGFLFLGHSESITGIKLPLSTVANTVFQRK